MKNTFTDYCSIEKGWTKKGLSLFLFISIFCTHSFGQNNNLIISGGKLSMNLSPNGSLFNNSDTGYFIHSDFEQVSAILSGGIWISGFNRANGNLHLSVCSNSKRTGDFFRGPLDTLNANSGDTNSFNQVYKINKQQIEDHINNWNKPNYVAPAEVLNWPGSGPDASNFAKVLAPFYDFNQNLKYEPEIGEAPYSAFNELWYIIFNDNSGNRFSNAPALGVEVHLSLFFPQNSNENVFLRYQIINRSNNIYDSLILGFYSEFEIGNPEDDYCGTDSSLNIAFSYNADTFDQKFGNYPPSIGMQLLSSDADKMMAFNNNLDLTGLPQNDTQFYYYLAGRWTDGKPLQNLGNGYSGSDQPGNFIYNGDVCNPGGWTEISELLPPGNRNMLISKSFGSLLPKGFIQADMAYSFVKENGYLQSVCKFKDESQKLKNEYSKILSTNNITSISLYPNPSNGLINIPNSLAGFGFRLINSQGKLIINSQVNNSFIDLRNLNLSSGIYFIEFVNEKNTDRYISKIVIQ